LIIDDSAVGQRQTPERDLGSDPGIEVIGTRIRPIRRRRRIQQDMPDVIRLDVEMRAWTASHSWRKLMAQHPVPVVMCSSLSERIDDSDPGA